MNPYHPLLRGISDLPEICIQRPTAKEEAEYVDHLVSRLAFYRKHGYSVALPQHPIVNLIASPTSETRKVKLRNDLRQYVALRLYVPDAYAKGIQRLQQEMDVIQQAIGQCQRFHAAWNFKLLRNYNIVLTLYGTGGSYDVRTGRIIVRTNPEGIFKRDHPSHTVVHEMVHIGVEEGIVRRFQLTHTEKERLVDLVCSVGLADVLAGYDVSPRGDPGMDPYVSRDAFDDLPRAIEHYVRDFPRSMQAA